VSGEFTVSVEPDGVAFLRISAKNDFPIPPVIVADSYLVSLKASGSRPQKLGGTITVTNKGSHSLAPWRIGEGLPNWLSVSVTASGKSQTFANTVNAAGLKPGLYHAIVRADNVEPVSGRPMSALYYDVDLEVDGTAGGRSE